jgi:hypothetical protein
VHIENNVAACLSLSEEELIALRRILLAEMNRPHDMAHRLLGRLEAPRGKHVYTYRYSLTVHGSLDVRADREEDVHAHATAIMPMFPGWVEASELDFHVRSPYGGDIVVIGSEDSDSDDDLTEWEARAMFHTYVSEDCGLTPYGVASLYADPLRLEESWRIWLRQTQIENGFVGEDEARGWTPT